jgi:hypothetical protein
MCRLGLQKVCVGATALKQYVYVNKFYSADEFFDVV